MRIVFCDTETTGLSPDHCAVISYCAAVWNDGDVTALTHRKVLPWDGAVITPEACRVNGYNAPGWAAEGATPLNAEDIKTFHEYLNGAVVGGSNVGFDKGFIAAECRRLGAQPPRWNHRNADTSAMAFPLVVAGAVENAGLAALAEYFGVTHERPHDAVSDVEATIQVFERLCDELLFRPRQWKEALAEIYAKAGPESGIVSYDAKACAKIAGDALGVGGGP